MRRFRYCLRPRDGACRRAQRMPAPFGYCDLAKSHYCDHKFAFLYDPCKEPEGIPFYLPKPLLIVAKNFRNIEETKVGRPIRPPSRISSTTRRSMPT